SEAPSLTLQAGNSRSSLYIVTKDQILITQIESSIGDDGMGPDLAAFARQLGLPRDFEATALLPTLGIGLDHDDRAISFAVAKQMAIRSRDRSFTQLAALFPTNLAGFEVQAHPPTSVRVAVDAIADFHDAAMVVCHFLVRIDFLGVNPIALGRQPN